MRKWTAAIYLAVVCGVFAASGIACGTSSGCYSCDKEDEYSDDASGGSVTKLAAPTLTMDGNNVSWTPIAGAIAYEYKITNADGTIAKTGTITDLSKPLVVALTHGQSLSVRAFAEKAEDDGDWSEVKTYTAPNTLGVPTVTLSKQGYASWAAVPNSTGEYEYLITDTDGKTKETGTVKGLRMEDALDIGESIAVKALGDGIQYASGDWCKPVLCTQKEASGADVEDNERPDEPIIKPGAGGEGGEEIVFDESKLGGMLNYKESFTAEVGEKANIPIVYVQYDGAWYEAFPWVTCGNEKVDIGGRGTRFYVNKMEDHVIDYYVEIGGVQKIATTGVTVLDTRGPSFDLPASANGMLVYKDRAAALPDWTAFDYSGVEGGEYNGVTVTVKDPNGGNVTLNGNKFTPTQFGNYQVTYSAKDTLGNASSVSFTVECARMVEICNFDTEDSAWAWQYYKGEETLGELSEEHRYGDEGHSLKVTTRGTGEGGYIKVVAIPNYFDLSGFDEIAFTIYASESLGGTSAGIYLLNNESLYNQPYNLSKGENIVRYTISDFSKDYPDGKLLNAEAAYRSSDHIWLQFRGPEGVELYIDNMVGVFYAETGADREPPIVDMGAGAAIAESKIEDVATYQGAYGNISVTAGDTIKSAIDRHVHVCDNSMDYINTTYKITLNGTDVSTEVLNGTRVATLGETYVLTVTATDKSGNTTTKSEEIVVRQKFPTYTKVGMEEITLNYGNDVNTVKLESSGTVKLRNDIDKNGRVQVETVAINETMYLKLTLPNDSGDRRAMTATDVALMEYINIKMLIDNTGAELSLGNGTLLCRMVSGWNNVTIDKATLTAAINDGTYNTTTGELKFNIYCPLGLPNKISIYEAKGVYAEGNMPFEKELPILGTPQVTIDITTGEASWEAIDNAVSYTVYVDGVEKTTQAGTTYTLQDEQTIEVRANGDGVNYDDGKNNGISIAKTYYNGKVMLNNCEDAIYFDTAATEELSEEHVKEGKKSMKITSTGNWQAMYVYLRIDDKALSKAQWMEYEYIEMSVYAETSGLSLYLVSTPIATLTQGENIVRMTTKDLLDNIDKYANDPDVNVYNNGFAYMQLSAAGHTVYFDKIMAVVGNGSAYVPPQTDDDEEEPDVESPTIIGTLLNACDENGGWIATNATVSLDSQYKTQGSYSLKTEAVNGNYINIYVRDYNQDSVPHLSKAQLMEYDFFYMDVYNAGTSDVVLYMKDNTTVAAMLKAGAWTSVSFSREDINTWFDDNAAGSYGAYNTFYVQTNATLHFDNVLGCMQSRNPDFVVGENGNSGETTRDENVLNTFTSVNDIGFVNYALAVPTKTVTENGVQVKFTGTETSYTYLDFGIFLTKADGTAYTAEEISNFNSITLSFTASGTNNTLFGLANPHANGLFNIVDGVNTITFTKEMLQTCYNENNLLIARDGSLYLTVNQLIDGLTFEFTSMVKA